MENAFKENNELFERYNEVYKLSVKMASTDPNLVYRADKYQSFVVSNLTLNKSPCVVNIQETGQGKTF
jgi:hypothetical protein